jgi:hypothetical protein
MLCTNLVMLVVVVVARSAVISLRRTAVASLLSIATGRRAAVALLSALSAEASLRAIAVLLRLLALAVAALGLVLWRTAVLAGRRRGVAIVALLAAGLVGRGGRRAGVGPAGGGRRVVAVAVVSVGGLVVLRTVSLRFLHHALRAHR